MAIISGDKLSGNNDEKLDRLKEAKEITSNLSYNLQIFADKVKSSIINVDTTSIEEVNYCNEIISIMNSLVNKIQQNQPELQGLSLFDEVNLTDDLGNAAQEVKNWVVCILSVENDVFCYMNVRIVSARTEKEAIYKYNTVVDCEIGLASCLGILDETADYYNSIQNKTIIE